MARELHADIALDVAPGTIVSIVEFATGVPATLYADEAGTPLAEVVVQPGGFWEAWLDEGRYLASIPGTTGGPQPFTVLTKAGLEGPAGPAGPTGPTGPTGATGPSGAAAGGYQTGDLRLTALPTVESGWHVCDGAAVSRTGATKALFEAIGTAYGEGDKSTTFNVPDFRGRSPMGAGKGEGGEESESFVERTLGTKVGRAVHKLVTGQLAKHTHTVTDAGHTHAGASGNSFMQNNGPERFKVEGSGYGIGTSASTASAKAAVSNSDTGSGEVHPNVHPSTIVNVWIKL